MQLPQPPVTTAIRGQIDLIEEVITSFPTGGRLLDIGTGSGLAARRFYEAGWDVTATGFDMDAYLGTSPLPEGITVVADVDICAARPFEDASFDAIWCAHVLEHISNPGQALAELRRLLKPNGWLFITVPPYKPQIVGGHVNTGWNLGSLMYVLADAGFALKEGRFVQHGYNVFGMVQRGKGPLAAGRLRRANGDIETLAAAGRFPRGFRPKQGFNGQRPTLNWQWQCPPKDIPVSRRELAVLPPVQRLKIGFFVPWISMGKGETETIGQMMANAMAARGHEVTIFTFDDSRAPSRWPLHSGISLVHFPEVEDEPSDHRMAVDIASRNLDLLVGLHTNRTLLRYVRCAHRVGLPLVLCEQSDPRFPKWIDAFTPEDRDLAMAGATAIHVVLDEIRTTVHPSAQPKIRVIPHTVPEPGTLATPGAEKEQHTLLAVARLEPRQNMARLVDAFARLASDCPEWRLQIIGDGPLRPQLEQQARALGLAGRIAFAEEQDDLSPCYAAADLFVIPSLFDGFPLSLCTAMAHGLPAVGFAACSGVRAQISDEETGLLCPQDDVDALASTLRQLMQDTTIRGQMGEAARQRFLQRFSNDIIHTAWEEMFAEAAEQSISCPKPDHETLMAVRLWEQVWGPSPQNDTFLHETKKASER